MSLSRALTTAGLRRNKDPVGRTASQRGPRDGKPTISGPINLISTTNIMVQQAMADQILPLSPADSYSDKTGTTTPIMSTAGTPGPAGGLPFLAQRPKPDPLPPTPVSRSSGPSRMPSKAGPNASPHFSISSSGSAARSVSSSKTGSLASLKCPSLVTDSSSPKTPSRYHNHTSHGLSDTDASSPSSATFSSLSKQGGAGSATPVSRLNGHSGRTGTGMPSIPERAPSRTLHFRNHNMSTAAGRRESGNTSASGSSRRQSPARKTNLSVHTTGPTICRDSHQIFSALPLTPQDSDLFSEEYQVLNEVAREMEGEPKPGTGSAHDSATGSIGYSFPRYTAADYHALIAPLYNEFISDMCRQ